MRQVPRVKILRAASWNDAGKFVAAFSSAHQHVAQLGAASEQPGLSPPLLPAIARDPKEMWQLLAEAAA
jgi:hypothetical protein